MPGQQIPAMVAIMCNDLSNISTKVYSHSPDTEVAVFTLLVTYLWLKILAGIWRET